MYSPTPPEIVTELNHHIVGQADAKRAVAIALRNRWRRAQLDDNLRDEVTPKNILMIGPTGVGKTEIARRLAKLANAPFVKVEATKFTEVGYVGRDVDSIIRELVDSAVKMCRDAEMEKVRHVAEDAAEERLLDILLPPARETGGHNLRASEDGAARQMFRKRLREGKLDEEEVSLALDNPVGRMEIMGPPGMEEMTDQLQKMMQNFAQDRKKERKVLVKNARKALIEEEMHKRIDEETIKAKAIQQAEQHGIVFLDEVDKICRRENAYGADVSREGVQRDLLPLIEGCTVSTKHGTIKTDYILFIASGAFHTSKPSDLIPELQGRLPIRVELQALKSEDFVRILTEPKASLTEQYTALLGVEGLTVHFTPDGVQKIADIAFQANEQIENIGARRLHTVMERLFEEASFTAAENKGEVLAITASYVENRLGALVKNEDLSRFIL